MRSAGPSTSTRGRRIASSRPSNAVAERKPRFITQSGVEIDRLYTPADLRDPANDPDRDRPRYRFSPPRRTAHAGWDEIDDLGLPGEPPFTRGIHPTGLSRPPVDDAHVRRLRHRRGHQRSASRT